MRRQTGFRFRIESLKKEAKRWLKRVRAGDSAALERFRAVLPDHAEEITLRTVQHALAREHGAPGWRALLESCDARERELATVADEILRHAIFRGDPAVAARLFERHPEVAELDIYTATAAGDLAAVERLLAATPAAATRPGGPLQWPPLLYLTYTRLPAAAAHSIAIARVLLDHAADPNASWNDGWDNPFTALCGVIGLGEGVQPPHERAPELAELLLERGANPCDTQAFYNTSIVDDDTYWLDVLWTHSERRGVTASWRALGGKLKPTALDFMLSIAVSYNHLRRAEWLLARGANPSGWNSYSQRLQREEALVHGNDAMAELLVRHGAADEPLRGKAAFQAACRRGDRAEARQLAAAHPEFLREAAPILTAARAGRRAIVELLLDLGMDVDIVDGGDIRALNLAAGSGAVDVVKLLLERGADPDRPTKHYGGPMGFAAHFGQRRAAEVLAPHSRDVHNMVFLGLKERLRELFAAEPALVNLVHFRSGLTSLFTLPADEAAALDMARFLLERGADPSFRGPNGDTPAAAARKRGFEVLAALLDAENRPRHQTR